MAIYNGYDLMRFCGLMSIKQQPYWYATFCQHCTQDLFNRKSAQYPTHYDHGSDYARDILMQYVGSDCVGLLKGFFWAGPGGWRKIIDAIGNVDAEIPRTYQGYGVPDYSADQMYNYFSSQAGIGRYGDISSLPVDHACLMLHSPGHCGIYVGNGYSIEASSRFSMVIYLPLEGRPNPWTEWTYFPDTLIDNNIIYKPYNPNNDPYFIMHIILALKKRKVAGVYGPKR